MKIKINIFDIQQQAKDFFRSSDSGSQMLPQNPFNILWLLENHVGIHPKKQNYINKIKQEMPHYTEGSIFKLEHNSPILDIILNEELIAKRMEDLYKKGASFKEDGIAIVRYNSLPLLKKAISLDMDINYYRDGNYPLRNGFMRKSPALSEYLMTLPDIKLDYLDMNGLTIVHNMIAKKAYRAMIKTWKSKPELFLIKTEKGETSLEYMKHLGKNFFETPSKNLITIKRMIIDLIEYYEHNDKTVLEKLNTENSSYYYDMSIFLKEYLTYKLNNNLNISDKKSIKLKI